LATFLPCETGFGGCKNGDKGVTAMCGGRGLERGEIKEGRKQGQGQCGCTPLKTDTRCSHTAGLVV